jgi:hypothetical protein
LQRKFKNRKDAKENNSIVYNRYYNNGKQRFRAIRQTGHHQKILCWEQFYDAG